MNTLKQLTDAMTYDSQKRIIEDLRELYETDAEMLADLVDDNSEILNKVHEWADGQISVYTGEVYKWISEHFSEVCRYEEDAIREYGATTIEKIGQKCWYLTEEERANDAISEARKVIENFDNTAT